MVSTTIITSSDDALTAGLRPEESARLLEAQERRYWQPDDATLEALRSATQDVEDRLEGIHDMVAA